jgi:hypothetical protein
MQRQSAATAPNTADQLTQAARRCDNGLDEITTALRAAPQLHSSTAHGSTALRCRMEPYLDQGGACGAAGPAPAPGLSLGGPPGRTPGRTLEAGRSDGLYAKR